MCDQRVVRLSQTTLIGPRDAANVRGPDDEPCRGFLLGHSVSASPDVWQSAANVALVLSMLGPGIVPAAWLILTTPTDHGSDS
jgi:hypothetical protein